MTWATYQDHPCASVVFRRTRGAAATTSTVVIPVQSFPAGFNWKQAQEELQRRPAREIPNVAPGLADEPRSGVLQLTSGLNYEGTLVLAETADRICAIPGLVVVRIETEQVDDEGGPVFVILTLADERLFSGFGISNRWRFNTRLPDGSLSLDTVKPDGSPYTLEEVARHLAGSAWRKPPLGRVPTDWRTTSREAQFTPFPPAMDSLERLAGLARCEDPVLHLDGSVGIYRPGEGLLGYAPDGKGPNTTPVPPEFVLRESGDEQGAASESTFPPEWVVVVGEDRVATVALDGWEPVVLLDGQPFLLSEELVRLLTGGKPIEQRDPEDSSVRTVTVEGGRYGLEWLEKWIMLPNADLGANGVDGETLRFLADQAWNFWRMPGVEEIKGGFYTGKPGRNAHLLPMLDRAETRRGRRLGPTVYAASWETKRRTLNTTAEFSRLRNAREVMAEIRTAVRDRLTLRGVGGRSALDSEASVTGGGLGDNVAARSVAQLTGLTVDEMAGGLVPAGVDSGILEKAIREYRRIAKLREAGEDALASRFEQALLREVQAEDALGDPRVDTYSVAKELVEFERLAFETAAGEERTAAIFQAQFGPIVRERLRDLARKRRAKLRERQADEEAGRPRGQLLSYVYLQNNPRSPDSSARVVAADLGVVRTSKRSGNAAREDVNLPKLTSFVPIPPRVLFGATVRPRVDVPPGFPSQSTTRDRQATGANPDEAALSLLNQLAGALLGDPGVGDFVPPALGDEASVYVQAFRRQGRAPVATPLEAVPLDQAIRLRRPWRELVPLTEAGNRDALDAEALKLAAGLMAPLDRTTSRTASFAGPWPINCDGLVSAVEIRMEQVADGPCGFTTRAAIGGEALVPDDGRTRTR